MAYFQTDTLWISQLADGVAALVLNVPERSINVLGRQVLADLETALDRIEAEPSFQLLLIRSGKPGSFIAGADLHEFRAVESAADAIAISERGQHLFNKLAGLRMPTVAVISGPCLGGGLELALACDYRVVVDQPRTQLGLPEIELGLLPAWGGTQRLPRVVGLERALQMILGTRRLRAKEALRWGLADGLADEASEEPPAFLAEVVKRPKERLPMRSWRQRLIESNRLGRWLIFRGTDRVLQRRLPDDMPAPWEAVQAVRVGLEQGLEAGLAYEREAVGRLATSPACRNLVALFFRREEARKLPEEQGNGDPAIRRVGIVGAGTMGAGIAQLAALRGCHVVLQEINETALAEGILRVLGLFQRAVERGVLPAGDLPSRLALVHGTTAWKGFAEVDLVIEAIVEDLQAKRELFRDLEKQTSPSAILATNTSSLRVQHLQEGLKHPGRVAGLHFFNPVHKMPLVEVVRSPATRERVAAALLRWAVELGKTPILVKDGPGFLVNRILMPYLNEAVLLAAEGMRFELIDQAMRRFGMPAGPLELLDQVGLDVAAHIAASIGPLFSERFAPNPIFALMEEQRWLGQKVGRGFYLYRRGQRGRVNPGLDALLRDLGLAARHRIEAAAPAELMAAARERMVGLMVNEAAACLGEEIAVSADRIDLAMVLGAGWAPHRGGPLTYGRQIGFENVVKSLMELAERLDPRFKPCSELRRLASSGGGAARHP
jgi:3-hydroxyacyl-CoA dehydrogenase/enoyl-CoA hydratase/3-hydroxybutyryl-CoA epimerase